MILVLRGGMCLASLRGHLILEIRERERLLAYRSSAVRKLSVQ